MLQKEVYKQVEITNTLEEDYGEYAKYIIQSRALPDVRDGLKPVHRRVLYSMYKSGTVSSKPFRKSARTVGNVIGTYHPHGDCLAGDTEVYLLNGQVKTIEELYKEGKNQHILSVDEKGKVVPAVAHSFRIGQYADKIYHIKLSNGRILTATGNHPFLTWDKEWVKAEDLEERIFLYSSYVEQDTRGFSRIKNNVIGNLEHIHQMVGNDMYGTLEEGMLNGHVNGDRTNNDPENIKRMTRKELLEVQRTRGKNAEEKQTKRVDRRNFVEQTSKRHALNKVLHILKVLKTEGKELTLEEYDNYRNKLIEQGERYVPRAESLKEEFEDIKDHFNSHLVYVEEIEVEMVDQKPMYDFTVEGTENLLIKVGEDNGKTHLISVHNSSVYEALVRMAQEWKLAIPLIDFQGNKGSVDGDGAAAMRYTESRLHKIVETGFFTGVDKKGVVPHIHNYDGTLEEPTVLPVHFCNVLVNGSTGVASGYATGIPTHNITEVLEAQIYLLENPGALLEDVMELLPAPDFPTGGVILNAEELKKVYINGKGKVQLRSNYEVDTKSVKNRKLLVVTEIPYEVNKSTLVEKLHGVAMSKKVDGLIDARDESDREGLRIVIECQAEANEQVILSYLFRNTDLRKDYNMNMVVIDDKRPKQLGLIEILNSFNVFRLEIRRKELEYDLEKLKDRVHIMNGFVKLIDILEEVIAVIQDSKGRKGSREAIIEKFDFTDKQATAIVDLQLYRISKEDKEKYEKDKAQLDRMIDVISRLLRSKNGVRNNVKKQYEDLITEFGEKRRTKVVMEEENWEVTKLDVIKEEDVMVSVTEQGYIKRSSMRSYGSSKANGAVEGDEILIESAATTKSYLLLFTNENRYMYIPVHEIQDTRWGDEGQYIASLGVDLKEDERIINAYVIEDTDLDKYILTAKSNGLVKRTTVREHAVTRYFNLYDATRLRKDEKLLGAWLVEDNGYLGFIGKGKRAMYFPINEIAPKGLKTNGMAGMTLEADGYVEEVAFVLEEKEMTLPYVLRKRGHNGVKFK